MPLNEKLLRFLGKNNINLRVIMQRTNTTILFPDAADPNIPPIRRGSVSITGTIHNVYAARQVRIVIVIIFPLEGIGSKTGTLQKRNVFY